MGRVSDTVGTVNTTLRTMLMLVLVGGAGYGGYKAYEFYNEPRQKLADKDAELASVRDSLKKASTDLLARQQEIESLNTELAAKAAEVERLEVAMRLLKVRRRLARLTVLDQRERPQTEAVAAVAEQPESTPTTNVVTRIEFVEVDEKGDPIGEAKQFSIVGDMVYVDYLQVTFDDKYVEEADLDRSTSIVLFHRLFGEHQEAVDGYLLDTVGTRPTAYSRGTEMSDFERKIWDDFWLIANDSSRAAELGIFAAHGSAVSMRVKPEMTYEIELRSTGTMTMKPVEAKAADTPAPSDTSE
jgi:hypothetical protein